MRAFLFVCFLIGFLIPATCVAEIRIIAVRVTSDSKSQTRVSIYSDVAKENKLNVSVKEAVAVMRKAEGWGSSVKVGIVADNVLLGEYLPLLNTISQNLMLELAFIDAEKPNFIHRNIRQRIEEAEAGERESDTPDSKAAESPTVRASRTRRSRPMRIRKFLAMMAAFVFAVVPSASFGWYSVTDGLDPAKLKKDNVKIAVVKVKDTRVVRPETRKRFADGSSTYTFAIYSIDLELVEQLYGEKLTDADLSNVGYSNVPDDNAWALGPSDPKGCYYIMAWRHGHPCGQASGVRFSPGPDLPVLIDKPHHPSVKLVEELLAIVNSPMEAGKRKAAIAAKLKELRNALGIQVPGLDPGVPIKLGSTSLADGKDANSADVRGDWKKDLFPVDRNGKWGFIDAKGQIVIEPAFDEVAYFSEGLAAVKLDGKYGYLNKTGKIVIEPQFRYAFAFREGLAWVDGDTDGFIDKAGQIVLTAPSGMYCREFREGLAKTMRRQPRFPSLDHDGKYKVGFIDKTGEYAVRPEFDAAWDFHEGLAAVQRDGRWGFIDKTGQFVIQPQYERASYFSEGLAAVEQDGKTIFINKDGNRVIDAEYEDAHGFIEDFSAVKIGGKWGFIDRNGKVRIKPGFDEVSSFFNGVASIVMSKKYGYINQGGEVVVEPTYGYGHFFLGELAGVTFHPEQADGAGTGYINRDGHVVWAPKPKARD